MTYADTKLDAERSTSSLANSSKTIWCEERRRLDAELRTLLNQKTTIREQVSSEMLPGNRRISLIKITALIDDTLALLKAHDRHCPCEAETTAPTAE